MGEYVNFQGKNVDDAIASACGHYKATREELEIEIVSGGSSGIFGLVGVKKARIKARRREPLAAGTALGKTLPEKSKPAPTSRPAPKAKPVPQAQSPSRPRPVSQEKSAARPKPAAEAKSAPRSKPKPKSKAAPRPRQAAKPAPASENTSKAAPQTRDSRPAAGHDSRRPSRPVKDASLKTKDVPSGEEKEETPRVPVQFSAEEATAYIVQSLKVLLSNISDEGVITVNMDTTPFEVVIDDEANSGLIIGRDGQTISALQYLLNRIVSRKFPGIPRLQLDAGDYREKQDEQLRKTALFLAQKAITSQRTQSTRPLSSYHRRVVHMTLQEERDIQTRSKGDGPMKRVLVIPRRKKNGGPARENSGAKQQTAPPDTNGNPGNKQPAAVPDMTNGDISDTKA